nr:hypothetical protein CFP56_54993 [Quercus suber]
MLGLGRLMMFWGSISRLLSQNAIPTVSGRATRSSMLYFQPALGREAIYGMDRENGDGAMKDNPRVQLYQCLHRGWDALSGSTITQDDQKTRRALLLDIKMALAIRSCPVHMSGHLMLRPVPSYPIDLFSVWLGPTRWTSRDSEDPGNRCLGFMTVAYVLTNTSEASGDPLKIHG